MFGIQSSHTTLHQLATTRHLVGTATVGNFSGGAYTEFESDGTLRMRGSATVVVDLLGPASQVKVLGVGVALNDAEQSIDFTATSDLSDYIWTPYQIQHEWLLGSTVYPHLHWEQASNATPNWLIRYRWQRNGQAKTSAWSDYKCNTNAFTYVSGTLNQISYGAGIAPPAGYALSDILQIRVFRDNANTSTVFTGADAYSGTVSLTGADVHIELDTLGSRSEYTK